MLNRTNRTLSAKTNRLDLGTRMLGLKAGDNNGSLTLRTARQISTFVVRAGVEEYQGIPVEVPPIQASPKPMEAAMPPMPGSSSRSSSPDRGLRTWDQGQSAMSSQDHPGSNLAWPCDPTRRMTRSARAARTLLAGATPAT